MTRPPVRSHGNLARALGLALALGSFTLARPARGATLADCIVGEDRGPSHFSGSDWRPGVVYYTRVDSTLCTCSGDEFRIDRVLFSAFEHESCRSYIGVSVVEAQGTGACLRPDTARAVSAQEVFAVDFTYPPPSGADAMQHSLSLSVSVPLNGPAFLRFEILGTTCGDPGNGIGLPALCVPCRTYWRTPRYEATLAVPQDGCDWLLRGNAAISAASRCGLPVTARSQSWGALKSHGQ